MNSPAWQFYPKQWLGDDKVLLMGLAAQGLHLRFMCIAWQQEPACTLPNDDEMLRTWAGNPADWETLKVQVFRAWDLQDGRWIQRGLLKEHQKQQENSEKRRHAANIRWGNEPRPPMTPPTMPPDSEGIQVHSKRNALHTSSSISTSIAKAAAPESLAKQEPPPTLLPDFPESTEFIVSCFPTATGTQIEQVIVSGKKLAEDISDAELNYILRKTYKGPGKQTSPVLWAKHLIPEEGARLFGEQRFKASRGAPQYTCKRCGDSGQVYRPEAEIRSGENVGSWADRVLRIPENDRYQACPVCAAVPKKPMRKVA